MVEFTSLYEYEKGVLSKRSDTEPGEPEGLTAEQIERTENRSGGISVPIQPDHGPGDHAVVEAAAILRELVLSCDPRTRDPEPVPLSVRIAAESWLDAHVPPAVQAGESNG